MPDGIRSPSLTPSAMLPPSNSLKRKEPSNDRDHKLFPAANALPAGANMQLGEYETGRVICEVCGGGVSFRDEDTGGFTLKHWDAHRLTCVAPGPTSNQTVIYTPESTAEALAHPPAKRRRAKRTEEERIEYLRADPYVAQFEAYRVLCASCEKWIRLRPNSTYCSIPWDAHRKSCLAKKINNKNVYALEERNNLFSKDPDVRKFDAERVLCNMCDSWIHIPPDDHLQAVQKWLQHRALCQKNSSSHDNSKGPHLSEQHLPPTSGASVHRSSLSSISSPVSPKGTPASQHHPSSRHHPESPSSFHDLNPSNFAPAHESRRRNAEQRAATLRADNLIGEVEPNRVFCTLCQKWVQLRQDSSYCAYPWLQHRGKCLARHQRRAQKAAEIAEINKSKRYGPMEEDELLSDSVEGSEDPESEEMISHAEEERNRRMEAKRMERHKELYPSKSKLRSLSHITTHNKYGLNGSIPSGYRIDARGPLYPGRHGRPLDEDVDAEGEADADGSFIDDDQAASRSAPRVPMRRPWPLGLADLDSPSGRKYFISASIDYLFATTYEATDEMSISALLTYLNAAMPQDKHEDFDTSEVVRAVAHLHDKGRVVFEGDTLRPVD